MSRFTISVILAGLLLVANICRQSHAGSRFDCHLTGEIEIQHSEGGQGGGGTGGGGCSGGGCSGGTGGGSGGGHDGGSCGGDDGGSCGGHDGGSGGGHDGGSCGGDDGGSCDGHDGGTCHHVSVKNAYVEISVHHEASSDNDAIGMFRHWVTNTVFCDTVDCETCENSEEGPCFETTIQREMIVDVRFMNADIEAKDSLVYISGECIYDSKTTKSKMGKILFAEVFDGGKPSSGADIISWKWLTEEPDEYPETLNTKQILGGNLTVHYNPSQEKKEK